MSRLEVKTEGWYSADIYPWRNMSALCPRNISRRIYVFFKVATHTCSQSYWSWSQAMAGGFHNPLLPVDHNLSSWFLVVTMTACVFGHLEKDIYPSWDVMRTYILRDICPHYILLRFSALGKRKAPLSFCMRGLSKNVTCIYCACSHAPTTRRHLFVGGGDGWERIGQKTG